MREIKFRAWSAETKEMVKVAYLDLTGDKIYYENGIKSLNRAQELSFWNKPFILMQYTGLKDKNGVEIYERDICIIDEGLSDYWYVVEWVYGGFQAVTYKKKGSNVRGIADGVNSFYIEPNEASVMTVIGNIYENPELLETKKSS